MKGLLFVSAFLLLLAAPALAASAVVTQVSSAEGVISAPVTVPINFGSEELGEIETASLTICFKQQTSPGDACDASGTVSLREQLAPPFYLAGQFRVTGVKTLVSFPVTLQAGQRLEVWTQWIADRLGGVTDDLVLRATPSGGSFDDIILRHSGNGLTAGPCVPSSQGLCLNDDRFKVRGHYLTTAALAGASSTQPLTDETGYFWFFNANNVEAVIKVLNACGFNNRFWVFAGGLTDVRTAISVTDTEKDAVRTYINPQGTPFQPIQDTQAFATCP